MKRIVLIALFFAGIIQVSSQEALAQCLNDDHYFENLAKEDPASYTRMQEALDLWKVAQNNTVQSKKKTVYKIPVVFHVVHEYGEENISKAQILDQMRILNEDFRRLNADASKTRSIFQAVAADVEIEFVLATKDPNGNCTEGIVRVYSPLTNNARDNVKAVSYWPSDKYLNVWVVRSIENSQLDPNMITLGYAQFPWDRSRYPGTDGIVLRSDVVGSIGAGGAFNNVGRTATHEIGHWLGLFHTFQGGCNGGDNINDTPPESASASGCPLGVNTCSNDNPNLPDQVENYMDYSNGTCQNIFTTGQKNLMHTMINGYRNVIVSSSNATFTGINQSAGNCGPLADLSNTVFPICEGNSVSFKDISYNGTVSSRTWTFEGGTPATSNLANPTITYSKAGVYYVSLEVGNSNGTSTKRRDSSVVVHPAISSHSAPSTENFESGKFPPNEWTSIASEGVKWESYSGAGSWGPTSARVRINSQTPDGTTVQMRMMPVDMIAISDPVLKFDLAYARLVSGSIDRFKVFSSIDCGVTWVLIYQRAGYQMETGTLGTANFVPSSSQWEGHNVSLKNYVGRRNLLLRFDVQTNQGGNIYLDNINVGSITSIQEANNLSSTKLYPNPTNSSATLELESLESGTLKIRVMDVSGKEVIKNKEIVIDAGTHSCQLDLSGVQSGVYFVESELNGQKLIRKLMVVK